MPEPDHARHETRFDQRRYRAGGVRYPFYRLWGLVLVGYLAAFAIDPLQHLIWFGPWFASVVISLAACFGTWWLARVDVHTQHAGDIADREVDRRTWGLTWRLWGIGFVLSLVFNGVMFCPWFQYVPDAWYLITPRAQFEDGSVGSRGDTFVRQHPLQPLNGKTDGSPKHSSLAFWKPFVQWMVAGVTLGSLATLLGITVQWMWEDKSAIEPI